MMGILTNVIGALLGFIGGRLYEKMKKVQFTSSSWYLFYGVRDNVGDIRYLLARPNLPVANLRFSFHASFFNEKTNPVGIHQFCVQFVRGPKQSQMIVEEQNLLTSDDEGHTGIKKQVLEPHKWVEMKVVGFLPADSPAQKADSVWLVAQDARGKKFGPWHVADLKPWPSMVEKAPPGKGD